MTIQEKIYYVRKNGVTIKLLSRISNIAESTLYSFTANQKKLNEDKILRLNATLDKLIMIIQGEI